MEAGVIPEFRGEYYFLSNYYTAPFIWRGIEFKSAEQAFAYAKTFFAIDDKPRDYEGDFVSEGEYFQSHILKAETPGEAKKLGRQVKIQVAEWDARKIMYMREIVHAKFMTGEGNLVGKLINTGAKMLVEGNTWNDRFWGRCLDKDTGKMVGLNALGVILMEERGFWRSQSVCVECKRVV